MNPASYVIVDLQTGQAVFETFNRKTAERINTEKFKAVPILEYLVSLNSEGGQ